MRATCIEELEIAREARADIGDGLVRAQVHCFVLDRAPEAFDEDVVPPAAGASHADGDLAAAQHVQELGPRELAALIDVEDLWRAEAIECLLEGGDADVIRPRDRERARQIGKDPTRAAPSRRLRVSRYRPRWGGGTAASSTDAK